jgi:hypothetical protein
MNTSGTVEATSRNLHEDAGTTTWCWHLPGHFLVWPVPCAMVAVMSAFAIRAAGADRLLGDRFWPMQNGCAGAVGQLTHCGRCRPTG